MKLLNARNYLSLALSITALGLPTAAMAQVKVGVIQGLSGPPAIVDFGESYLQGIKMALLDYQARGGKTKIELVTYDDEATNLRVMPSRAIALLP